MGWLKISFRYFFSSAIQSSSGEVSSESVKEIIKKIISEESPEHPTSDGKIVNILKDKNIEIARRTVAKYRDELRIPSMNQRKKVPIGYLNSLKQFDATSNRRTTDEHKCNRSTH